MKTFFKRLFAVPVTLLGVVFMVACIYINVFVKLPMALSRAADFSASAGIVVGTILGTGTLIAICVAIIAGGCWLWNKD